MKIGLLLNLNAQQMLSNRLQVHNLEVAFDTNQTLHRIAESLGVLDHLVDQVDAIHDTLGQMAELQAEQANLVRRERTLKEVIYQAEKFVREARQAGDSVAAAYGVRRLFEVIDDPNTGFSTSDLAELADKERFDALLEHGRRILTRLSKSQQDELDEFERLLSLFMQRTTTDFDPSAIHSFKPRKELPPGFNEDPPPSPVDPELEKLANGESESDAEGCAGCILLIWCFGFTIFVCLGISMVGNPEDFKNVEHPWLRGLFSISVGLLPYAILVQRQAVTDG